MGMYRVSILGAYAGQDVANVMGWNINEAFPGLQAAAIADAVGQEWKTRMLPLLSDKYSVSGVLAYSVNDPSRGGAAAVAGTGGAAGAALPGFVAAKVKIITGLRGRAFQGRTGLVGITEAMTSSDNPNTLNESSRAALQTAFNDFVLNAEARFTAEADLDLGVVSTVSKGVKRATPIFTPGISYDVASALGTRVSRLR